VACIDMMNLSLQCTRTVAWCVICSVLEQ